MTISQDGELWVPVEITLIGKTGFLEAWRKGMEEWTAHETPAREAGAVQTRRARSCIAPWGLKETDLGLQYGRTEAIVERFRKDLDRLIERMTADLVAAAKAQGRKKDYNRLGVPLPGSEATMRQKRRSARP